MTARRINIKNPGSELKRLLIFEKLAEFGTIGSYGQSMESFICEGNRNREFYTLYSTFIGWFDKRTKICLP